MLGLKIIAWDLARFLMVLLLVLEKQEFVRDYKG